MKTKSPLQILNTELNTCKANAPREKVMVAGGWFIKETAEQTKKDLKEFKDSLDAKPLHWWNLTSILALMLKKQP